MNKKLTLSLDQGIIEKAKTYAKHNKTSLSKMIEAYFDSLTNTEVKNKSEIETTPLVESLCGIITLPKDFDYKNERLKRIQEKYK